MALNWFYCKKCASLIKNEGSPRDSGCTGGHGSFHDWQKLAEVGNTNYHCNKCGITIQANSSPKDSGCPGGGGSFHNWAKY